MERFFFGCGAVAAGVGVGLGAFAAHALRDRLAPESLAIFETGVRYQMYHALGLIAAALASQRWPGTPASLAGWAFLAGIVLFSGSLYALALSGWRALGAVTPLGGLALLVGWVCLAWASWR